SQKSGLEIGLKLGSSDLVQSHVSCGVEKNPMGLWCRLFKCTRYMHSKMNTLVSQQAQPDRR
ncbi:hypothetical protein, partial [Nitrosomonas sp. PY1]|uniref:hypothetical protein n=1 Tax=Nitrosomonas sp. PY1 TaxID=1803906 RepID=UPI001FC88380